MGGPFQPMNRFPTFIIIEAGDDDSDSQDFGLFPPGRTVLPSETSSSNQDTVFPTLLLQQRQQQREQREAEEAERRHSDTGSNRPQHQRRSRRHGGGTDSAGRRTFRVDGPDTVQAAKDEKNEAKKTRNTVPNTPTGIDAAGALARLHQPADKKVADKDNEKNIPEAEKTVMRMDHIETTLTNAAAALHKMGCFFGRPISAPSGNDCTGGQATNGVVVRRAKSQWDAPLGRDNEEEKLIYDLPSESTYEYASVWSNSTSTVTETTLTTSGTDASKETTQSSETDTDVNYLRPTVSLENITVLDKAQARDRGRQLTRKRQ